MGQNCLITESTELSKGRKLHRINVTIIPVKHFFILRDTSRGWRTLLPSNPFPPLRVAQPVGFLSGAATVSHRCPRLS